MQLCPIMLEMAYVDRAQLHSIFQLTMQALENMVIIVIYVWLFRYICVEK